MSKYTSKYGTLTREDIALPEFGSPQYAEQLATEAAVIPGAAQVAKVAAETLETPEEYKNRVESFKKAQDKAEKLDSLIQAGGLTAGTIASIIAGIFTGGSLSAPAFSMGKSSAEMTGKFVGAQEFENMDLDPTVKEAFVERYEQGQGILGVPLSEGAAGSLITSGITDLAYKDPIDDLKDTIFKKNQEIQSKKFNNKLGVDRQAFEKAREDYILEEQVPYKPMYKSRKSAAQELLENL